MNLPQRRDTKLRDKKLASLPQSTGRKRWRSDLFISFVAACLQSDVFLIGGCTVSEGAMSEEGVVLLQPEEVREEYRRKDARGISTSVRERYMKAFAEIRGRV